MFKKILVPVDLNDLTLTKAALDKAVALARIDGCDLRLLYVMALVPSSYMEYVPADFEGNERKRMSDDLLVHAKALGLPEGKVTTALRSGGVYHEVLAEADTWHADLIVTGSHNPTLATYLIGSHATNIVRHAHCSVLVVRS
jgi:nucleotide-binding universal stress UspA family protein